MRWRVLCIVEGVNEYNSTVENVHAEDWIADLAILASTVYKPDGQTKVMLIVIP